MTNKPPTNLERHLSETWNRLTYRIRLLQADKKYKKAGASKGEIERLKKLRHKVESDIKMARKTRSKVKKHTGN